MLTELTQQILQLSLTKNNNIMKAKHCVFNLHVHLVFVTKYRYKTLTKEILDHLKHIFSTACASLESNLVEFNGEADHVYLLITYPPKLSISTLVHCLKGRSSYIIRKTNYKSIRAKYWCKSLWSPSYFAGSCGGAPINHQAIHL